LDHYSRLTSFADAGTRGVRTLVEDRPAAGAVRRVAILGNHLPRRCGIATFTSHLGAAISGAFPAIDCFVLAMNDREYDYPDEVRFSIDQGDLAAYRRAADFLTTAAGCCGPKSPGSTCSASSRRSANTPTAAAMRFACGPLPSIRRRCPTSTWTT
jgi:hypothetical protein